MLGAGLSQHSHRYPHQPDDKHDQRRDDSTYCSRHKFASVFKGTPSVITLRTLCARSGLDCEFEQPLSVAAVDSISLVLRDVEPVNHFDCLPSIERSALRIEGRI